MNNIYERFQNNGILIFKYRVSAKSRFLLSLLGE